MDEEAQLAWALAEGMTQQEEDEYNRAQLEHALRASQEPSVNDRATVNEAGKQDPPLECAGATQAKLDAAAVATGVAARERHAEAAHRPVPVKPVASQPAAAPQSAWALCGMPEPPSLAELAPPRPQPAPVAAVARPAARDAVAAAAAARHVAVAAPVVAAPQVLEERRLREEQVRLSRCSTFSENVRTRIKTQLPLWRLTVRARRRTCVPLLLFRLGTRGAAGPSLRRSLLWRRMRRHRLATGAHATCAWTHRARTACARHVCLSPRRAQPCTRLSARGSSQPRWLTSRMMRRCCSGWCGVLDVVAVGLMSALQISHSFSHSPHSLTQAEASTRGLGSLVLRHRFAGAVPLPDSNVTLGAAGLGSKERLIVEAK